MRLVAGMMCCVIAFAIVLMTLSYPRLTTGEGNTFITSVIDCSSGFSTSEADHTTINDEVIRWSTDELRMRSSKQSRYKMLRGESCTRTELNVKER